MSDDEIRELAIAGLKKKYFDLAPKEKYPNSSAISEELDKLEKKIKELEACPSAISA